MEQFAATLTPGQRVLDVGSYDVNGCLRPLFVPQHTYVGLDLEPGPNVDVVAESKYTLRPIESESFDVVVTANMLEHAAMPWKTVLELYRVLRHGGTLAMTTPWKLHYHGENHFKDYYRFSHDAMALLFGEWLEENNRKPFQIVENRIDTIDTWLVAVKP